MKKFISILTLCLMILISCDTNITHKVEVKKTESGFQLYRDGKPMYIKGAGIESHYDVLAESGGNSIRTWGVDSWDEVFAMAEKYDLTVNAGLWLEQERQGFDYSDSVAVKKQFERFKKYILKYKDHPNLLMWGVGNEMNLFYENFAVWDAVEEIAKFIHEVDGNHPTMTATAFIEKREADLIKTKCPNIDILCINAYAGLPVVADWLDDFGWEKPYILGEWGTFGHWEVGKTSWQEPIEFTRKEKADLYMREYQEYLLPNSNCLGGYVFFWGAKQERTPTWYGIFLADGAKTQAVDVMHFLWKDEWPADLSPIMDSLRIDNKSAQSNIIVEPNSKHEAKAWVRDLERGSLTYKWEILEETTDKRVGGDEEAKPPVAKYKILEQKNNSLIFNAPKNKGAYRLFVYVYDNAGNGSHANIPFLVK